MQQTLLGTSSTYVKVAILIKETALDRIQLIRHYASHSATLPAHYFIGFSLYYNENNKCPATQAKEYLADLLPEIDAIGIDTLLVCDANYFKFLTKNTKAEPYYGYVCPCMIDGFEHLQIVLCPNYQAMLYNPNLQDKIDRSLATLTEHVQGQYVDPGENIIHFTYYPETLNDIMKTLNALKKYPELTCDIETRSLEFWSCGVSSIAFAWDRHKGTAFGIDRGPEGVTPTYRPKALQQAIRALVRDFLMTYEGKLIWHNVSYDGKVLVYQLFMDALNDYPGMLDGINVLTKKFDDTKIIAYLATNNAVQNILGLKELAAPFTGNYAQEDIKNTDTIPYAELLEYNLKDCLATWYVKETYEPIMITDLQQDLYEGLMKDTIKTLMQTELCGMPIYPDKVQAAKAQLTAIVDGCNQFFENSSIVQAFHKEQLELLAESMTEKAVKKVYTINDEIIYRNEFNPGSDVQVRKLIYDYLGYPALDLTKTKQAATGGKTIEKLMGHCTDPKHMEIFEQLRKRADADIILTTFIPAFENAQQLPDGSWRLYGNFNLGGTQSLRLSSSNPNLQNLPASSTFAKIIKACFGTIPGWLFVGSDFDSLEDKVNALLTEDPNKLKVYIDGYDGHCLRTQSYWPEEMPNIDPTSVSSINSIKQLYKSFRQRSKAPTFALTYGGTFRTLVTNCGFPEEEAKRIEKQYHKLYAVSDAWIKDKIEMAKQIGYVPMAFGGRIRTPLLAKTIGTGRSVTFAAKKEALSAGNAATQSYCALTLRAFNEFMRRVWASPYKYKILPAATIHDAIYLVPQDRSKIIEWININLIECMAWQGLPEIQHPQIRITSGMEIYWPSWIKGIEVPNNTSEQEIKTICTTAKGKITP